jgi:rRNA-processing protein FCF1
MRAVIDSSSWISLARAGLLDILRAVPVEPVLLDVVHAEIVNEGRRGGYADAAALTAAVTVIPVTTTKGRGSPADARVLDIAQDVGVLIANDLALGRRARSVGILWIRTADLIVLAVRSGSMSSADGTDGLRALEETGRISRELADEYREQLQ